MLDLILADFDLQTQSLTNEVAFSIADVAKLCKIVNIDFGDDREIDYEYDIDQTGMRSLKDALNLDGISGNQVGKLRKASSYDKLGYGSHNGRELMLMTQGRKPMAYFASFENDSLGLMKPLTEAFRRFVATGIICEDKFVLISDDPAISCIDYQVYTLKDESWRAIALRLLKLAGFRSGWSEGMERVESALLGYEEWQTDLYLRLRFAGNQT